MAATTLVESSTSKTMLIFQQGEGLKITRFNLRAKSKKEMALSADEIEAIAAQWPAWQKFLSDAGAPNVEPSMHSRSGSTASLLPGNSPSSPQPGLDR